MNKVAAEDSAAALLRQIWREKHVLWPNGTPHPVDMLQPEIAAKVLGVHFERADELGNFGFRGERFETAGLIDRQRKLIVVSRRFPATTQRFTAAHEIGHWLMHSGEVIHRDRPIDGPIQNKYSRSSVEREADYFAACFLMPPNLVRSAFQQVFETEIPLLFNDTTAFFLNPSNPRILLSSPDPMERAMALASAEQYAGRHFYSLAQQFKVSPGAMARRILELSLIAD